MIRRLDAIVAECPIEELEAIGRKNDMAAVAHRARNAYDALRAFVRRHAPERAARMRIIGDGYRNGHITLKDVATLLGMSTSDAVFELELYGFCRPPAAIQLSDADRDAAYAILRQRRLSRGEVQPGVDQELVERDAIASERIEGIDARAWIRRR
jgi:hypothetical protein